MFYIVRFSYVPNTAACNRMLSMIQALSDLRVETKVIFMMPDNLFSKVSKEYPCVTFEYYWEKLYINNKYFKYISYYLYVQRLIRRLNINDNVLVLGGCGILSQIVRKKGINVYHEMTEHPLCVDLGDRLFKISLNKYVNTLKKINGLFVISNALKDYFVSQGICEQKIQVVNMTVDASRFDDIKKTELKERYIAYCGNGSNHKDGVDVLIKAFAIVAQTHEDVKLYLIGSDTSKDAIENKMLVKELGIESRVVFTGTVSASQMPTLLKNATVLALARPDSVQAKYGFPTKLGEYLLSENPVVLTRVGDMPLFLSDGESALFVSEGDIVSFAQKIKWCLENPNEANLIGKKGAMVAKAYFDANKEVKKIALSVGVAIK